MLMSSSSPRSGSPKRWGGGGSPILPARSHLGRGIMTGGNQGLRGSPNPSRPPHLPHPRSRSLDTALDKASDSTSSMAESTPHGGSVAGSLTDSTMPDSVVESATDSVTDLMAASDTDASDSGIFSRYHVKQSRWDDRKISTRKNAATIDSSPKEIASDSSISLKSSTVRRPTKSYFGSKEDLRSSGAQKGKYAKNISNISSEKDKFKRENKIASKLNIKNNEDLSNRTSVKNNPIEVVRPPSDDANDRLLFKKDDKNQNSVELDPYNNFYNRKNKLKSSLAAAAENVSKRNNSKDWSGKDSPKTASEATSSSRPIRDYPKHNPYISPLISNLYTKDNVARSSSTLPPSSPLSSSSLTASSLLSPSLLSSVTPSSPSSSPSPSYLPHKRQESAFTFPRQGVSSGFTKEVRIPPSIASSKIHRDIPSSPEKSFRNSPVNLALAKNSSYRTEIPKAEAELLSKRNERFSSPFSAPKYKKPFKEGLDLHREGSHIDLVASCQKYLEEDELKNACEDEDDMTLACNTRRSSLSSIGSNTSSRRLRRLSSIPVDDDLTITEEDQKLYDSESPTKSDTSHEMAIFSAIAALSQAGFSGGDRGDGDSTGDYDGTTTDSDSMDTDKRRRRKDLSGTLCPPTDTYTIPSPVSSITDSDTLRRSSCGTPTHISTLGTTTSSSSATGVTDIPARSSTATPVTVAGMRNAAVPNDRQTLTDTSANAASSSLLDKCVSRVRTFIRK